MALSQDGLHLLCWQGVSDLPREVAELVWMDLVKETSRRLDHHRIRLRSYTDSGSFLALDPTGGLAISGDYDGVVRVGAVSGEEPHHLLGHQGFVHAVAVSTDGDWIASAGTDATIRLWPMPDMDEPPFHTLPYEEILDRLRAVTNLRVVEYEASSTGYRRYTSPFPGWETVPEW
jgi:WD40 repeat protein